MIDCYITLFKPPINMCSNKMNWLITWHHRFCYFNGFLILFPLMHSHRFKLFLVTFTSSSAFFLWKSESLCSDDSSEWFDFMNNAIFFFLRWEKDWGYEVTGDSTSSYVVLHHFTNSETKGCIFWSILLLTGFFQENEICSQLFYSLFPEY